MRDSLQVALLVILEEIKYLDDNIRKGAPPALIERFQTKRDHLVEAGQWIEQQLIATR